MITITKRQAGQFILAKQGLIGTYRFAGKAGAYDYVRQAGCIQYDPVDVCGKNAELTLQSRVKGFKKSMLRDLLYKDRLLTDYADKELSIWPTEDWPYFSSYGTFSIHGKYTRRRSSVSMVIILCPYSTEKSLSDVSKRSRIEQSIFFM